MSIFRGTYLIVNTKENKILLSILRGTNGEEETTSPEGSPGPPSICAHHQQVGYHDIYDDDAGDEYDDDGD